MFWQKENIHFEHYFPTVRGPQWLMQYQIEDLKNNNSVIKTDYNITRKGDLKSIEVYISKNKNKDDFEIKY